MPPTTAPEKIIPYRAEDFAAGIISADDALRTLSTFARCGFKLLICTYTYNHILVDNLKDKIHKMLFAIPSLYIPKNSRVLKTNHTKLYIAGESYKHKNKERFSPVIAFLGSGNFVGANVLHDYFVKLDKKQTNEALKLFDYLWEKGTPV